MRPKTSESEGHQLELGASFGGKEALDTSPFNKKALLFFLYSYSSLNGTVLAFTQIHTKRQTQFCITQSRP